MYDENLECGLCDFFKTTKDMSNIKLDKIPNDNTVYNLSEFYKAFSDPTRIKILYTLARGEICVCNISNNLKMSQSAISHQLKVLRNNNIVKFKKIGKTVYYSLCDNHIKLILQQGLSHINE